MTKYYYSSMTYNSSSQVVADSFKRLCESLCPPLWGCGELWRITGSMSAVYRVSLYPETPHAGFRLKRERERQTTEVVRQLSSGTVSVRRMWIHKRSPVKRSKKYNRTTALQRTLHLKPQVNVPHAKAEVHGHEQMLVQTVKLPQFTVQCISSKKLFNLVRSISLLYFILFDTECAVILHCIFLPKLT